MPPGGGRLGGRNEMAKCFPERTEHRGDDGYTFILKSKMRTAKSANDADDLIVFFSDRIICLPGSISYQPEELAAGRDGNGGAFGRAVDGERVVGIGPTVAVRHVRALLEDESSKGCLP